jgi:hypothetical protein
MIKPTIGRIVLYHPEFVPDTGTNEETFPAIVCAVHSDEYVNLAVFDSVGNHHPALTVRLIQDGDNRPAGAYAEWMPYQKAVAAGTQPPTLHAQPDPAAKA